MVRHERPALAPRPPRPPRAEPQPPEQWI